MKKNIIKFIASALMVGFAVVAFAVPTKAESFTKHFSGIMKTQDFDRMYYFALGSGQAKGMSEEAYFGSTLSTFMTNPSALKKANPSLYNYYNKMYNDKAYQGLFPDKKVMNSLQRGTLKQDMENEMKAKQKEAELRAAANMQKAQLEMQKNKAEAEVKMQQEKARVEMEKKRQEQEAETFRQQQKILEEAIKKMGH